LSVATAGSAEGAVGGNSDGVNVALVASQGGAELAGGQVPDLDELIVTAGDDDGVGGVGGETNAADPVAVSLVDGVLSLGKGVPELDALIAGTRDDLTVVGREGNGEDVLGVAHKAARGGTLVQVPQSDGGIPGGREGELAVGGEHYILNKVVVATQGTLGNSIAELITGKTPLDEGLIARTGDQQVGGGGRVGIRGRGNGGNPAGMVGKLASQG